MINGLWKEAPRPLDAPGRFRARLHACLQQAEPAQVRPCSQPVAQGWRAGSLREQRARSRAALSLARPRSFLPLPPRHSVGHRVSNAECCSNPTLGCPPPRDYCSAGSGQGPGICISTSVRGVILEGCRPHFEDPTSGTRKVPPPRRSALCVRPPAFVCWASLGGSLDPSRPRPQFNGHPAPYSFGDLPGPQLLRLCGVGDASPGLLGLSGSWAGVNESFPRAPKWLSLLFHALELGCVVRQGHVATVGFQGMSIFLNPSDSI